MKCEINFLKTKVLKYSKKKEGKCKYEQFIQFQVRY